MWQCIVFQPRNVEPNAWPRSLKNDLVFALSADTGLGEAGLALILAVQVDCRRCHEQRLQVRTAKRGAGGLADGEGDFLDETTVRCIAGNPACTPLGILEMILTVDDRAVRIEVLT